MTPSHPRPLPSLTLPATRGEAGAFVFLGSQTPIDRTSGAVSSRFSDMPSEIADRVRSGMLMVDVPDESIIVQTWRILANVRDLLASDDAFERIVHQRFFVRDIRDAAALERVVIATMGSALPSTTIVETRSGGLDTEIVVHADFIVLHGEAGTRRENVSIPHLDFLTAPFPLATRAGQYLFTSPIAGIDPGNRQLVTRFEQLQPDEQRRAEPPYALSGESAAAQQVIIFRHIETILRSQASSLEWQLRQNGWLRLPMRDFGPVSRVRRQLFTGRNTGPFTSVQVSAIRHPEAHFEYSVIALIPPSLPEHDQRHVAVGAHGIASYYIAAVRAGRYVITAGEVPVEPSSPRVILNLGDLDQAAAAFAYGRIEQRTVGMAQAYFTYGKLRDCLAVHGSSLDRVVQQTVYMVKPWEFAALERVATLFYGARLPPTTVVPIVATSPYSAAEIEIELFATTDGQP